MRKAGKSRLDERPSTATCKIASVHAFYISGLRKRWHKLTCMKLSAGGLTEAKLVRRLRDKSIWSGNGHTTASGLETEPQMQTVRKQRGNWKCTEDGNKTGGGLETETKNINFCRRRLLWDEVTIHCDGGKIVCRRKHNLRWSGNGNTIEGYQDRRDNSWWSGVGYTIKGGQKTEQQ
jgi:hypothetical protein